MNKVGGVYNLVDARRAPGYSKQRGAVKKYLVVGASGQVGRRIFRLLESRPDIQVIGTQNSQARHEFVKLNLAEPDRVTALMRRLRPDVVLIPGGITNVDYCEDHEDEAMAVHAAGPELMAREAEAYGGYVVYFSTDYVFDGAEGPYSEEATPNPVSAYARSKLEGERRVLAASRRACVLRTCGVYSFDPGSKNFLMHVYGRLKRGERVQAFVDQYLTPTYAGVVAAAAVEVADLRIPGILHVAGTDWVNRVEFCRRVAAAFGWDGSLVDPVPTASVPLKARRPLRAGLRTDRARATLRTRISGLDAALAEVTRLARGS